MYILNISPLLAGRVDVSFGDTKQKKVSFLGCPCCLFSVSFLFQFDFQCVSITLGAVGGRPTKKNLIANANP